LALDGATRVVVVCPGLDHVHRGFESFARECFEELRGEDGLALELVKGSGPRARDERSVPTLRGDRAPARLLGRALRRPGFVAEHLTFSASLVPLLARRRADVVYFSEWHVGKALALWPRRRGRPALVMCNGGSSPGPYDHLDAVQQLSPPALQWVLDRGADPERNVMLPLGFRIPPEFEPLTPDDRRALRRRLDLPVDRRVVVSVAALNRQKRIDYLIEEVASLSEPRPYLLLVGQAEAETPPLRALAASRLGSDGFGMRTVPRREVDELRAASDVFVLASLWENLPRALIEAIAQGLPSIAHAYPTIEYAIGDAGLTADLERPGALAAALSSVADSDLSAERAVARHRSAYERFSWDVLRPRYVELLTRTAVAA
jgi:1,2-diacylglycerol 3-alpha-glucosyltransferase